MTSFFRWNGQQPGFGRGLPWSRRKKNHTPPPAPVGGLVRRLGSRLFDIALVAIPTMITLRMVGAIFGLDDADAASSQWFSDAGVSLVLFAYFTSCESRHGVTLGKKLLHLRVVTHTGSRPSPAATAKRNAWLLAGAVPEVGGLLLLMIAFLLVAGMARNSNGKAYHDRLGETFVVAPS